MTTYSEYNLKTLAKMTGAERLRATVRMVDNCRESFVDEFTTDNLVTLWMAYFLSDYDWTPDHWSRRQVARAMGGIVPTWDESGEPVYYDEMAVCFDSLGRLV